MGGGVFDREFTKSLIIHDFDDVLKNPFRYVHLFLLHTLLSKKIPKITMHDLDPRPIGGWGCTATLNPLLQVLHGNFQKLFLIIMCVIGKDPHI